MSEEKDRLLQTLEKLWKIVQIAAVLVGGFWTYVKFIHTEAPLFETNVRMTRSLSDPKGTPGGCIRSFSVGFENTGKSVLTVRKVLTRGWKFDFQRGKDRFAELLDLDKIQAQGQELFRKEFPDTRFPDAAWFPFLGRYRSGEKYSHEFSLLLKNEDDAWVYLQTEIFVEGEARPKVSGMWAAVCG